MTREEFKLLFAKEMRWRINRKGQFETHVTKVRSIADEIEGFDPWDTDVYVEFGNGMILCTRIE